MAFAYTDPIKTPILHKMGEALGLECAMTRVHFQEPGGTVFNHFDGMPMYIEAFPEMLEHKDEIGRFVIALTPFEMGHVWAFGNTYWRRWKVGEIIHWDWRRAPHATANMSFHTRALMQITGRITDKTRKFIEDGKINPEREINI